jgi:hypothetical protein
MWPACDPTGREREWERERERERERRHKYEGEYESLRQRGRCVQAMGKTKL